MNHTKKLLSLALALILMLGCLAGCKSEVTPDFTTPTGGQKSDAAGTAMGRYVEQDVSIPECAYPLDMVMLSSGALRFAALDETETPCIYTMAADGSWETMSLPSEILDSGSVADLALSPDGSIFCYAVQTDENWNVEAHSLWRVDPSGGCHEIPNTYPDMDSIRFYLVTDCDFTSDGRLMVVVQYRELMELNMETGEFGENQNDLGIYVGDGYMGCAGENTYLLGTDAGTVYGNGEVKTLSDPAGDQLIRSVAAYSGYSEKKVTLWENEEGYLFFTTEEGLYSFVPGGSVTEELIDGDRTSIGDPTFAPFALVGGEDGSFYLLGYDGNTVLYHYIYDEDIPTEPETTLRIYSLYEDNSLRQMASLFQKANPNIAVDLEIGATGEDGITESDAIKALNTQILAGSGPDILNLDGLPLDSFLEKGILMDLGDTLGQSAPLLTQVTNCFASEGQICAVPTAFTLPAIYGPEEIIAQIHDMDSLVSAVEQARQHNPEATTALFAASGASMADRFYDSCSAAWRKSDGTLDESKLTEFYAGMKALFDLDADYREANAENISQMYIYNVGDYTGLLGAKEIHFGAGCNAGTLEGMDGWTTALAGDQALEGYDILPLNVQASNVFLPKRIMGILNTSTQRTEAEAFLTFMLSDQVQENNQSYGFPVNKTVFDRQIEEDKEAEGGFSSSWGDGTTISFDNLYPDARRRQALKTWVDALTTPALTDQTIREIVMEQMNDCCSGRTTPQEAAKAALRSLNLYLSE